MNILFINSGDINGGAPRLAYSLKQRLKKDGHGASMFVRLKYSTDPEVFPARWPSLFSRIIKKMTGKDLGSIISSKLHYLLATDIHWFNSDEILNTKEFKRADIIHCHNLHGNYFKLDTLRKMSRVKPIIWTFHDMWPITSHCGHAYSGKIVNGFYECPSLKTYQDLLWDNQKQLIETKRYIYKNSNFHIVVPSEWLFKKVSESILGNHPVSIIYNGIDHQIFCPSDKTEAKRHLSFPLNKKIILFGSARGASEEKGGEYLSAIAKHFATREDILFVCIGEDTSNPPYKQNNIKYVSYISQPTELVKYYNAADLFLFTSLAENFPLIVLETLSSGLPVVSFDVGGVKEAVIHKKHGYIAKYKNTEDLINGINFVLSLNPAEYKKMSEDARKTVIENFTLDRMYESYFSLYKKLATDFTRR